jgi:hypothetical protein
VPLQNRYHDSMKTIKVDGRVYKKTAQFGNRSYKTIFKNRKAYDRKKEKQNEVI